ncbi:MAG: sulfatase-like hydrolase/transferase [bacterium]|nr:sulfatase-like hydrolase/transferase [bacterium]
MRTAVCLLGIIFSSALASLSAAASQPNIILVMADDMGWGQTGYYDHPILKTPNLDSMAAHGLRFDRFYAGAPNCSPTRATVMTGRSNDRAGVNNHGFALRRQERTVAQALRGAGYATGHFGKWHLNGIRGPGVPILASDDHNPGEFGFDEWLSVTNFFDRNPIMSRNGKFEEFEGDSSEIIVAEALEFVRKQAGAGKPFFAVIWYGTPHDPFFAADDDKAPFAGLDAKSREHYGELVAMDRSIGALRQGLRELNIAENTLVWFCSDNGGLPRIQPETVGGLRGFKSSLWEGGLRVPAIIEWPGGIAKPRVTSFPAATMDIFPTLAAVVGLPDSAMLEPRDGISLAPLFNNELERRDKPLPFRHTGRAALIDNNYKLLQPDLEKDQFELYDLSSDPKETKDISAEHPEVARRLRDALQAWNTSVEASVTGKDYPEGSVDPSEPEPRFWMTMSEYEPYFDEWRKRPEYGPRMK